MTDQTMVDLEDCITSFRYWEDSALTWADWIVVDTSKWRDDPTKEREKELKVSIDMCKSAMEMRKIYEERLEELGYTAQQVRKMAA